jgi:hypothetical protein
MLLRSLAALALAQFLPGLLLVKLLDVGRSREERLVLAAVLGGPVSALVYLASLLTGSTALYWALAAVLGLGGLLVPFRSPRDFDWPRRSVLTLGFLLAVVIGLYLLTTGSLYQPDAEGDFVLDRALQRDTLFHLGIARSLESSYPPRLLSVEGIPIGYHAGYHLQLALWSRFYGVDPVDGLVRVGPIWFLALYVLSAYLLARRFSGRETVRLFAAALMLASGAGFVLFFRPSVDWWSLTFMDWSLVSIFLANPLLPALPVFFAALCLLADYADTGSRGGLVAGAFASSFLFALKMFLGAQMLGALALSCLRRRDRRALVALGAVTLASSPFLLQTLFAASGSNTAVGMRPLEIVRYSMEKIDWREAVSSLADVGNFEAPEAGWLVVLAPALLWIVGFLGLRVAGLPGMMRDLSAPALLPRTLAWFAAIGFPLSLILRIAPSEALGLSRLESLNDAAWFATQSGVVLWFSTARALSSLRTATASVAVALLAFPATLQHFAYAASLETDRVARARFAAAHEAEVISGPQSVFVEPLDRARPSLLPYFAGRSVVYDPYVGYDYMFVGRDEIDYRRAAVAQFWISEDPAYPSWFLDRFGVDFVWREDRELPAAARAVLEPVFTDRGDSAGAVEILRVRKEAVAEGLARPLASAGNIPLGGRGQPYFGGGWERLETSPPQRLLPVGSANLYLPLEKETPSSLTLELEIPHEAGELRVDGVAIEVPEDAGAVSASFTPRAARGLHAVEVQWRGTTPLTVIGVRMTNP